MASGSWIDYDWMSVSVYLFVILGAISVSGRTFDDTVPQFPAHTTHTVAHQPSEVTELADAIDTDPTVTELPNIPTFLENSTEKTGLIDAARSNDVAAAPLCFYADESACTEPRPAGSGSCRECFAYNSDSIVCCNVTDIENALGCIMNTNKDNSSWVNLHIRNATLESLNLSISYLKQLHSFAITDGNITHIVSQFSKFPQQHCINVSNNHVHTIETRPFFTHLTSLEVLDLSYNNLTAIPTLFNKGNISLDISGNKEMLCKSILESMDRGGVHFVDPNETYCLTNQTFHWFNSTDIISLGQLELIRILPTECPTIPGRGSCKCHTERMAYEEKSQHSRIMASVDCSNMGLTELPEKLPENTRFLNVSNNNITNLMAFNNPSYEQIMKLYADDNQVKSLLDLEGTPFLQKFLMLSLRRNKLKSIPMYLLANTLDKSPNGLLEVYLEGNQLHCDCNTAKVLKVWLMTRTNQISDSNRIQCENSIQTVMELSEMRLCQSPHDWTDYIDCLIGIEIFLLVALVCKVSYDYWVFKTAGYLPWPASKMPKLPCDWLCES